MSESTKSLIRHILTALGTVLALLGVGKWTGAIDYVLANMDSVIAAVTGVVGFVVTLWGYFKNSDRFDARTS